MSDATIQRPDVQKVLSRLKPFQRDTAEYVFRRFYLDSDATNRFLVADEAGLGKTMVAKGVLAKAIDYLWDSVKRIDVVYICSNADIARQNINRLNLSGHGDNEFASRITLLPVRMKKLNEKLNFISFTPGTSFDLKSSMGIAEERRLIYWMLKDSWGFLGTGLLNVMQGGIRKHTTWRKYVEQFDVADIDPIICKEFINNLNTYIADEKAGKVDSVKERFEALCARFYRGNMRFEGGNVSERNHLIGIVRGILAKTCLKRLEPDIVILDEFQRFKNLLSDEDEAGQLAQELFNYADEHSKVRILLLSATPYKMYTQYDDQDDDHYKDFLKTVEFLEKGKPVGIEGLLKEFRQELFRYHDGDFNKLVDIKSRLEERLRKVIARKERIAGSIIHDDMLKDKSAERLPVLTTKDIQHYLALQNIAGCLDHGDMIEYWKSASYLLNFMDGYKIKERLHCAITEGRTEDLTAIINREPGVVLPWQEVARYGEVAPANPRLQQLFDDIIDNGAWQLLWMPPSLPYYSSEKGPYAKFSDQQLTKRLVFSSWNVVPKLIAAMVSYEAERRMFGLFENNPEYSPAWRKKQGTLLKFAVSERLSGMPVLGILYPCFTLGCCCDPLRLYSENLKSTNAVPSLDAVKHVVASKIQRLLDNLIIQDNASATTDENWYWAAPILLDLQQDRAATVDWLNQQRLDLLWCGVDGAGGDDKESNWSDHVGKAKEILDGTVSLGRRPDDLVQVLTLMALGGPAVVALRAVCRMAEDDSFHTNVDYRNAAASIAWGFRSFFNRPEVTCLLRGLNPGVVYWQRVLEYSTEGGLQSVLDEYVHVLPDFLGKIDSDPTEKVTAVATAVVASLQLITARIDIERLERLSLKKESEPKEQTVAPPQLRGHFALRFGIQDAEDGGTEPTREDRVRQAFNSPFWPFVLASTSVGQEGLDFHLYCHAIIHWNLPSNPVDLEQREGRIHRYKGHAIRKNIAKAYAHVVMDSPFRDPWKSMFAAAENDHSSGSRGLSPFWNFSVEGGARVERYVPALPFSRDQIKLLALRRSLAIYRMVFGQSRQEDLVGYLLQHLPEEEVSSVSRMLQIDLAAPCVDS